MTKHTAEPKDHQQSLAEIREMIYRFDKEERVLLAEEVAICDARKVGSPPPPVFDDHTRAVRAHYIRLMNGSAAPGMLLPPAIGREQEIRIQREAIALAMRDLRKLEDDALDREVAKWVAEHAGEWRSLAREIVLAAVRLASLEERARAMMDVGLQGRCARGLVMTQHIGWGYSLLGGGAGDPVRELWQAGLDQGVVTKSEIREATNV